MYIERERRKERKGKKDFQERRRRETEATRIWDAKARRMGEIQTNKQQGSQTMGLLFKKKKENS